MARYHLTEPVHLETHHADLGPIEVAFPAGEVSPRSEQEEAALSALAGMGLAEALPDTPVAEAEVSDAPQ